MKIWLLPCILVLATSCSHSAPKADANGAAAPAPGSAAAVQAPKGTRKLTAKVTAAAASDHALCKSATEQRELLIVPKGIGCEVEYTKENERKLIATAEHETDLCKQVLQKVRGHLEAAGFTCN
jgi:hypothetical protein